MNRIEINKELLSEVLDIHDIIHVQKEGSCSIFISRANNPAYIINIYEFAFKCKEFIVYKKGHNIEIEYCNIDGVHIQIMSLNKGIRRATEVEAVIKASEYILGI
jgi:hypothetical protein